MIKKFQCKNVANISKNINYEKKILKIHSTKTFQQGPIKKNNIQRIKIKVLSAC